MQPILEIEIGDHSFTKKELGIPPIGNIISGMLTTFGIDAALNISYTENEDFLTVNKQACRFPASLIAGVERYTDFLKESSGTAISDNTYWELIITGILFLQPGKLFPDKGLHNYMPALETLQGNDTTQTEERCRDIILELLNLKISLVERSLIAGVSNKYLSSPDVDWNDFREELIRSLMSPEITICFNHGYFNTAILVKAKDNFFQLLRDGLFYETGVRYPPFKIEFDSALPYNAYCFKINSLTSLPFIGLRVLDEILVNDAPDRLSLLNIQGREAVNPATGNTVSIIDGRDKEAVEKAGLITWDGLGYFILILSSFLRKYGYLCIDKKATSQLLEKFKLVYPKIAELIETQNLLALTARTLRLLAREEISIRNFRVILEAILDSDYIIADGHKDIIFDERVPVPANATIDWKMNAENIVEFVRSKLKKYISHKYTRGQSLAVYLLEPGIEKIVDPLIDTEENLTDKISRKIINAIRDEIADQPPSAQVPVILTGINVRPYLKKIIALEQPQLAVLSYQELVPEMNITPIARIALATE